MASLVLYTTNYPEKFSNVSMWYLFFLILGVRGQYFTIFCWLFIESFDL